MIPDPIQGFIDVQADRSTWNMLHLARLLKDSGGLPAYGNGARDWDLSQPEHPNPEYR